MTRLLAAFALISAFTLSALALDPPSDRIVVLISVDGLAHYYFDDPKAEMPTIRPLAAEGARADQPNVFRRNEAPLTAEGANITGGKVRTLGKGCAGIKASATTGTMSNTDVAPTMGALLGVKIPDADGKVLQDILTK